MSATNRVVPFPDFRQGRCSEVMLRSGMAHRGGGAAAALVFRLDNGGMAVITAHGPLCSGSGPIGLPMVAGAGRSSASAWALAGAVGETTLIITATTTGTTVGELSGRACLVANRRFLTGPKRTRESSHCLKAVSGSSGHRWLKCGTLGGGSIGAPVPRFPWRLRLLCLTRKGAPEIE